MTRVRDNGTGRFIKQDLGICKECDKPAWAKGYCKRHYNKYCMKKWL